MRFPVFPVRIRAEKAPLSANASERIVDVNPSPMHGTFNRFHLRRITSISTECAGNRTLTTFRVLEFPLPDLEAQLRLNATAMVILVDKTVEGRIIRHDSDRRSWFEFTLESG